jgi:hypothetical protein
MPIPDEADESSLTFRVLRAAQAHGDRQALLYVDRRVIRFHLGEDVPGNLKWLADGALREPPDQSKKEE